MFCNYWKELDDDVRSSYEFCRSAMKLCNCCGDTDQCTYKWSLYGDDEREVYIRGGQK